MYEEGPYGCLLTWTPREAMIAPGDVADSVGNQGGTTRGIAAQRKRGTYANVSCIQITMMEDDYVGGEGKTKTRLYTLRSPRRLARADDAHHSRRRET